MGKDRPVFDLMEERACKDPSDPGPFLDQWGGSSRSEWLFVTSLQIRSHPVLCLLHIQAEGQQPGDCEKRPGKQHGIHRVFTQ